MEKKRCPLPLREHHNDLEQERLQLEVWDHYPFTERTTSLFTARCLYFLSPKVNCAICSPKLVYVCVCLHMILGQMPNSGKFLPVNPVIYSSLCAFLPPKVNCAICSPKLVYVCACIWSRVNCLISVSFSRWIVLFTARCVHLCLPKWIAPSTVHG
jgi:hypothetical protein